MSATQFWKALLPIKVTLPLISAAVSEVQPRKALLLIWVIVSGKSIVCIFAQPVNAFSPTAAPPVTVTVFKDAGT